LFGGFDDDVAALKVDGLAAPRRGDEQFRALVDIDDRSVREPQHGVCPRACADIFSISDGATCFERARGDAVQSAFGRHNRGPRTARGHHGVDGVAPDIHGCEEQPGGRSQHAAPHPSGLLRRSLGEGGHDGDCCVAFQRRNQRATARAPTEMVFDQEAAAGAKVIAQIRLEIRAELRTNGAAGAGDLLPHARSR
jgi:hypothetical protein